MVLICLLLNSKVHEESVALAKPHLPLTAMTKTSLETQVAPQDSAAKSAEPPAKCGEREAESQSLCKSLEICLSKTMKGGFYFFPKTMMSPGLISPSLLCRANRVQMVSACQQPNYQQGVQRRALPQKVSMGSYYMSGCGFFVMTEIKIYDSGRKKPLGCK